MRHEFLIQIEQSFFHDDCKYIYNRDRLVNRLTNWTPWIVGACLVGGALVFLRQTRSPAAGPVDSAPKRRVDKPPRPDLQLKPDPDPFYME